MKFAHGHLPLTRLARVLLDGSLPAVGLLSQLQLVLSWWSPRGGGSKDCSGRLKWSQGCSCMAAVSAGGKWLLMAERRKQLLPGPLPWSPRCWGPRRRVVGPDSGHAVTCGHQARSAVPGARAGGGGAPEPSATAQGRRIPLADSPTALALAERNHGLSFLPA